MAEAGEEEDGEEVTHYPKTFWQWMYTGLLVFAPLVAVLHAFIHRYEKEAWPEINRAYFVRYIVQGFAYGLAMWLIVRARERRKKPPLA